MKSAILVIGANGGIGQALVTALLDRYPEQSVIAVARSQPVKPILSERLAYVEMDTTNDIAINAQVQQWKARGVQFSLAICTIGVLQDASADIFPEKKLEELNPARLAQYFHVNTIVPSLWLKALVNVGLPGMQVVLISARVGSISDNKLGGWYGYRASKAALNMVIKTAAVEYARRVKGSCLISYHPGTVDTPLSKPFQSNVSKNKLLSPEQTAACLLDILRQTENAESPLYLDWQGNTIDW